MSFSGHYEYLCSSGHLITVDAHYPADADTMCPFCQSPIEHACLVDTTNGYEEEGNPESCSGEVENIGFDDQWHTDHYGTRYATKLMRYKPVGERWSRKLP